MDEQLLRDSLAYVEAALRNIHTNAESRSLDPTEQAAFDEGVEYVRTHRAELEALEARRAEIERLADAAVPTVQPQIQNVNVNTRTGDDVFDTATLRSASVEEVRERALTAVESHLPRGVGDNAREDATRLLEANRRDSDLIARHIIRTSSPEYVRSFQDYMENPQGGMPRILSNAEARTAMSLTAGNGGVLVPQFLDPTIVLTNTGSINQIRPVASVSQITVDQWDGVTSAGVTAEWLGEGSAAADATPTFVGPTITAHKAAAWLFASYEVIMDSGFNEVGMLIADAFDRLEAIAHVTGTGSSQPFGLVTRLSGTGPVVAGSSGDAGAADFVVGDVYALDNALGQRYRPNAKFFMSRYFVNLIRNATDTRENFWQNFGGGQPPEMIGYPVLRNEQFGAFPALGKVGGTTLTSGSNDYPVILGDPSYYKIVDRIGTEIMFEPMVKDASTARPTGQAGWFAFKRTGADVLTSNAFKTLKL